MRSLQRVPRKLPAFLDHVRNCGAPVYIFGADIAGKVIHEVLRAEGVSITGFLDNNRNKCGKPIGSTPVLHADALAELERSAVILIASTYIADIIVQLEDRGFYEWVPIAEILGGLKPEAVATLLEGELRRNHAGGEFTRDFDTFVLGNMVRSQEKYLDPKCLYVRSVDLIVTEKCSLKCKDCSNLMQYYAAPKNVSTTELVDDIDDICAVADEINEIRIIGGDPLMNKDFHVATAHAATKPNVNRVVIYTNGTLCPPEEKIAAIVHPKVFVFITTYGSLSRSTDPVVSLLKKHGIPFNCQPAYGWTECADIERHDRSAEENEKLLKNCCAKHFTTLTDGKVFRCPFSANVERLAAIPECPSDYVSVRGARTLTEQALVDLRAKLRWFLREKPVISACDFCNGRTYGDPEIMPGIQTRVALSYERYDRPSVVPGIVGEGR